LEFEVRNVTGRYQPPARTLKKVIVGWGVDADIGNESGTAGNDLCRLERTIGSPYPNLTVQYQLAQEGGWSIPPPYQVGLRFVEGPVNNTRDTVRIRSDSLYGYWQYDHDILPGQPLGMTALQIFTLASGLSTPGQCYLALSGRYYGTPQILNSYERDIFGPGDKRFLIGSGPFDLPNDSVARFVVHIIGASDSTELIRKAELLGVEFPPDPVANSTSDVVLYPSIPNPASGSCLIRYALSKPSPVLLKVYDVSGRLVRELEKGLRSAGANSARWDGRDEFGKPVANGVYLYRLEVLDKSWVSKTVLLH
jgi:hypothetical protein